MRFVHESVIAAAPERVFAFHELPDALPRLVPPWDRVRVISAARSLRVGERAVLDVGVLGPLMMRVIAEHTAYDPPRMFEDRMVRGPFRVWIHRHELEAHAKGALLRDDITYEVPLGFLGRMAAPLAVVPRLRKMFAFRHEVTRRWCESGA